MGKHSKKSKKEKKHTKQKKSSHKDDSAKRSDETNKIKSKKRRHSSSSDSSGEEIKETTQKRDDWMNLSTTFASFSNVDRKKDKETEKKQAKEAAQYDPSKCTRELNPYWKHGGDGLPKFQKPTQNDSDSDHHNKSYDAKPKKSQSNWRKPREPSPKPPETLTATQSPSMTEKDLNLLAGKLVKAEIMGNSKLIEELKQKLEKGRALLAEAKSRGEEVMLTQTDRQGNSKPLILQHAESSGSSKKRKKPVDTHKDNQRVKYFPDDDKYSLKQMFENEKFNTVEAQQSEFVKIASKIRKNDDLDDLFADNVRRQKSDSDVDKKSRDKAISEHNKASTSLDNCCKCLQSTAMLKHLIISMGEFVYLSLPSNEPLMEGHCLITPIRHASSVTQLDENEWEEIKDFRRALCKLFASKDLVPIFFEIAVGFHKYPHMALECVPVPKTEGDLAPIYFKKAIDESEYEWSENKKLVSLKGKNVRKAIPKELPYFSVSFGLEEGFAHVIETEHLFPRNFAQEIIGGMLDLHHNKWRRPSRQSFEVQSQRVLQFTKQWHKYDCTTNKN